jgi:hypothetical protein
METTPWEELLRLARSGAQDEGEWKSNESKDSWREYVELAKTRDYTGDPAAAGRDLKEWLESLGIKLIPHGSQGRPAYAGEGRALETGSFWDHLIGNEQCLRDWQAVDVGLGCIVTSVVLRMNLPLIHVIHYSLTYSVHIY